jgi:hypothetical protein
VGARDLAEAAAAVLAEQDVALAIADVGEAEREDIAAHREVFGGLRQRTGLGLARWITLCHATLTLEEVVTPSPV